MKQLFLISLIVVATLSLAGNAYLWKAANKHKPLIVVNGEPITQFDLEDRVDYLYAKELLSKMVWTKLVLQEAERRKCLPTDADVTDAVHDMDRANPSVTYTARKSDPALKLFRDAVRTNLALRNLQVHDIKLAPNEAESYYRSHLGMFMLPTQTQSTAVVAKDPVARNAGRSMLAEGVAPDVIAATPGLKVVGVNVGLAGQLPPAISSKLLVLKPGQMGEYSLGTDTLIVKVVSVSPQSTPPFAAVRKKAEMAARLAKAPSQASVLNDLRRRADIAPVVERYADAIPPINRGTPPAQR
ncbi:MAG TPA: peptidyl-prolyl cis-trans isomerase [Capsulimonadaceae bacterium]|jgi:hypothetical protein